MAVSGRIPTTIDFRRARIRSERFVGRVDEIGALRTSYPPVTLILGEPGAGKSRLLAEAAIGGPVRTICITCHPSIASVPLEPLLAVMRELQGDRRHSHPWERPNEAERLVAIRKTLGRQTESTDVLIQVDDLQWADAQTLDAIAYLADRLRNRPLRWHLAARIGDEQSERLAVRLSQLRVGNVLRLREFDFAELRAFVAGVSDRAVDDGTLAELHTLSGGNPLYAEQLIAAAAAGDTAHSAGLQSLLADRIQSLTGDRLLVARAIAVHGELASLQILGETTGRPPESLAAAIEDLENRHVVISSPLGVRFRHELLRRACYLQIPDASRADLHSAMALITGDPWGKAHHLDGAGRRVEAATVLLRHGLAMVDRADFIEAKAALEGALERARGVSEISLQSHAGLAAIMAFTGDIEGALEAMRRVESSPVELSAPVKVDARCRFAEALFDASDDCALAMPYLQDAIADASVSAPDALPRLCALAGAVADRSGSSSEAERFLNRGIDSCTASTSARDRVRLLSWLAVVHGRLGDPDRGMREAEEAAAMAESYDLPAEYAQCCLQCCYLSDLRGDRQGFELWCRRGLDLPGRKLPRTKAVLRLFLSTAMKDRGALREALAIGIDAHEEARHGSPALHAQAACSLALTYAMLGRFDEAAAIVAEFAHIHTSDRWARAMRFVSGRVAELKGDLEIALLRYRTVCLTAPPDRDPEAFDIRARAGEARVAYCLGRIEEVRAVRAWMNGTALPDWPLVAGIRAEVEAYGLILDGRIVEGCALLERTAGSSKERFRSASLRAFAGLASTDRDAINEAIVEFDEMGAESAAEWIRRKAHAIGLRPRRRPRSRRELTASEQRITSLVRAGKTNGEIGRELGLSRRTVEHYVGNMLSKLGLRSRAQLAGIVITET